MSSMFTDFEKEYLIIFEVVKRRLEDLKKSDNTSVNDETIKEIDHQCLEANDLLTQMDLEMRTLNSASRPIFTTKMVGHRSNYNSFQSDYQRTKEQKQRSGLVGKSSSEQRQRMMNTNDRLAQQNEKIYQAQMAVEQADGTGQEILVELERNREALEGVRSKMDEFSGTIEVADKQVSSMQRRANREKNCIIA